MEIEELLSKIFTLKSNRVKVNWFRFISIVMSASIIILQYTVFLNTVSYKIEKIVGKINHYVSLSNFTKETVSILIYLIFYYFIISLLLNFLGYFKRALSSIAITESDYIDIKKTGKRKITKKMKKIGVGILSVTLITIAYGIILSQIKNYNPTKTPTDYWANYFSLLGTVVAVVGSVYIYIESEKREKEKSLERELKDKLEKINTSKIENLYPISIKVINEEKLSIEDIVNILTTISEVDTLTASVEYTENMIDPLSDSPVITNIVSYSGFDEHTEFIKNNYPELLKRVESYKKTTDQDEENKRLEKAILGEWIIAKKNAEKAKLIIGISGYDNKILEIYELPQYKHQENIFTQDKSNGRIRFTKYISKNYGGELKVLKNWTSRNPVLYPNYFDEYKTEISKLLSEQKIRNLEGNHDVIVVKTFLMK
ncbi:hypothetical protein HED34_11545 [Vagococcus fluvialis]|uniref:hypothetical protein n=1 Tax=Vagococcus fluvialis TaxID=2738 RepID=UPI0014329500|nr:hypothetical protein [Vagococcus fluvialis]NKC60593.1 hypothetical protein [Vagococcus fluvialis]NKD51423.1 hypothetical protein [Vagococcus fluvialis]